MDIHYNNSLELNHTCAINGTNAVLKKLGETTVHVNVHIYLKQKHVNHKYLHEWIPSMASKYLWVGGSGSRFSFHS
jgi:cellobiose-specific phosphotransferase system component IIC